jgi:hypothetical protein
MTVMDPRMTERISILGCFSEQNSKIIYIRFILIAILEDFAYFVP